MGVARSDCGYGMWLLLLFLVTINGEKVELGATETADFRGMEHTSFLQVVDVQTTTSDSPTVATPAPAIDARAGLLLGWSAAVTIAMSLLLSRNAADVSTDGPSYSGEHDKRLTGDARASTPVTSYHSMIPASMVSFDSYAITEAVKYGHETHEAGQDPFDSSIGDMSHTLSSSSTAPSNNRNFVPSSSSMSVAAESSSQR